MQRLGLVLEGGGMRGLYTAGVLDYFMEQDLYTDGVIGVSAGACHACSYASKQIHRAYRTNTDYLKNRNYMSLYSLLRTGDLFNVKFVYEEIPNSLDIYDYATFHANPMKLYAVCSNIESGSAEYIQCVNMRQDVQYIRASASLPLLSKIVEINQKKYLDGGICDSIPIRAFQKMGYEKNIVVLTRNKEYRKTANNLMWIMKRRYAQYPKFLKAIQNRHIYYNRCLDELALMEKQKQVFIIRPQKEVEISRLEKNPKRLHALYLDGYHDAKAHFQSLQDFIHTP